MKKLKKASVLSFLALYALFFGIAGYGGPSGGAKPAAKAHAAGSLGDLSKFSQIAGDTLKLAEAGDLIGAKKRIKDLETAWDQAEEKMRPLNGEDWKIADVAIDQALAKLRAKQPEQAACIEKLKTLIATFDRLQKSN